MPESSDEFEPRFVRVAAAHEIAPGTAAIFPVGRYEVAVFEVAGEFYALENCCPHQGGPLGEGWLDGPMVTCPWHGWCFDVRTGTMALGDFARVARFEVRRLDDGLYVSLEPLT